MRQRPVPGDHGDRRPRRDRLPGHQLTDPAALADIAEIPAHEGVVLLPRSLVDDWLRQRS